MLKNGILNLPKDSLVPFPKKLFFEENILKISTFFTNNIISAEAA
jgi:hypothetical protein